MKVHQGLPSEFRIHSFPPSASGAGPSCLWVKAVLHSGQTASLLQGHIKRQTMIHTCTCLYSQFRAPNLPDMQVSGLREEAGGPMQTQGKHAHFT